ncbi:MAG: hypothetical protein NVS9B3_00100 [Gemmatimonadaceae bacterium]
MNHLAIAGLLVLGACISRPPILQPAPTREWPATRSTSLAAAEGGRYADADRTLRDFVGRFPATAEAREALFWRAMYKLDPSNREASARDAMGLLDVYLSGSPPPPAELRAHALVMRRAAERVAQLEQRAAAPRAATSAADPAKDDELKQLREQLQKSQEELERIKRRLAAPKP